MKLRATKRSPIQLEELEPRQLMSGYQPTANEQVFLERLNDARANPAAYGSAIGLNLSNVAASQPLALDPQLTKAARDHSTDMSSRAYFSHNTPEGVSPGQRISGTGFAWSSWGESLAAGTAYPSPDEALRGLIIDNGVPDLGHRRHLLAIDAIYKTQGRAGAGVVSGGPLGNYYTLDSATSLDARPMVTGVVFNDANNSGRYDAGEGLSNVTITVAGAGSTTTYNTGGYSLPVNPGTYTVTASGGGLAAPVTRTITVGASNHRLNFNPPAAGGSFVQRLYQNALGRSPSASDVSYWTSVMPALGGPTGVANAIERSAEGRTYLAKSWYATYLGRGAANGEEQWAVAAMLNGASEEQALATLLASAEYSYHVSSMLHNPNWDQSLVQGLFRQFLNRWASANEVNYYLQNVLPFLGRAGTAAYVANSHEGRANAVRGYYSTLLQRGAPSSGEVAYWAASSLDRTGIRIMLEGSSEFFYKTA